MRHTPWGKIGLSMAKAYRKKLDRGKLADQVLETVALYDIEFDGP